MGNQTERMDLTKMISGLVGSFPVESIYVNRCQNKTEKRELIILIKYSYSKKRAARIRQIEEAFNILPAVRAHCFTTRIDRKSTRLNSSHVKISYAVFCLKKKNNKNTQPSRDR